MSGQKTPPPPDEPPAVHLDEAPAETVSTEAKRGARPREWWEGPTPAPAGEAIGDAPEAKVDRSRDRDGWWTRVYDEDGTQRGPEAETVYDEDEAQQGPEAETGSAKARWLVRAPMGDYYPVPEWMTEESGRSRPALSAGTWRLLYNLGAAVAGWGTGLAPLMLDAITECGRDYSISGALVLGGGTCLVIAEGWDRLTRHWWPPLAFIARVPLASAITALALYAPAS